MLKNLNPKRRKNLKLASVICTSVFSLIAVITATIAWYSYVHQVYSEGMKYSVTGTDGALSVLTVHRCKTNESTDTMLKFYSEDNGTNAINLDYYSHLNTSQPVLMLFKMQDGGVVPNRVSLNVLSRNPVAYEIVNTTNSSAPNYIDNFSFSSAVSFKVIAYTSNDYDTSNGQDPFNYNEVNVSGLTEKSFVNVENDHLVWSHVTNNQNDVGFSLFSGSGTTPLITYLAVIIDYNVTAINHILSKNTLNKDISFNCDFLMLMS